MTDHKSDSQDIRDKVNYLFYFPSEKEYNRLKTSIDNYITKYGKDKKLYNDEFNLVDYINDIYDTNIADAEPDTIPYFDKIKNYLSTGDDEIKMM